MKTEGDAIARMILIVVERKAQKKRMMSEFNEEIAAYEKAIFEAATHSAQIPLPFDKYDGQEDEQY